MPEPDFTVSWRIHDWRLDMEWDTPYDKPDAGACSYAYTGFCTPHPTPHHRRDLTYVREHHKDNEGNDTAGWVYTRCPAHQANWQATYNERATA